MDIAPGLQGLECTSLRETTALWGIGSQGSGLGCLRVRGGLGRWGRSRGGPRGGFLLIMGLLNVEWWDVVCARMCKCDFTMRTRLTGSRFFNLSEMAV